MKLIEMTVPSLAAVMMSWKRPRNVECIARSWSEFPLFRERIVWSNLFPAQALSVPKSVTLIHSTKDLGLYTRFHAAILSRCDAIFLQDDDLLVPHGTILQLFRRWREEPDRLHALFGRSPKQDNTYSKPHTRVDCECDIALTRAVIVSHEIVCRFICDAHAQKFYNLGGNTEDLVLSYAAMKYSGKKNRVWNLPYQELPCGRESLHIRDRDHFKYRTIVMQACQRWLKGEE